MRRPAAAVSARISPAAMASAIALPAAAALLAAWAAPRGPVTALHVIGSLIVAMAVGAGAGRLLRSRWSVVLAPAVFMLVFELARLPVSGPTVDAIALDSMYGILSFVGGRGL